MKAGIISADGTLIQTLLQPTNKNAGPQAGLALMEKVINLCIQKAGLLNSNPCAKSAGD